MNPIKIMEIKGQDWMKGLSIQAGLALGGLFQTASNFDPFETMGYFQPSLAPVRIDGTTITTKVNFLASFVNGADGYVAAMGDRSGTGAKTLYIIKTTDGSVIEYNDKIDQNAPTGAVTRSGMTIFGDYIVYEQLGSLRTNLLTPTVAGDNNILTSSLTSGSAASPTAFGVGHDQNLYYTATSNYSIGKIVNFEAINDNIASAFTFADRHNGRDITNDGIYTIIVTDNNPYKVAIGQKTCKIFFWDTIKSKADIIYDFNDQYVIAARYVDGKVIILGASGIWICNSSTSPRLVYPLASSVMPVNSYQVTVKGNIIYWISQGGGRVYAYGAKIGKDILSQPFTTSGSDNLGNALIASGTYMVASVDAGTNTPKVYLHNSGSTRDNATVSTATMQLGNPFSLSYIKVVLKSALSSGQEITLSVHAGNDAVISDTDTKTYAGVGAKKTLIFTTKAATNNVKNFEDIYLTINAVAGATVERATVYGVPAEDNSQLL